MKIKSIQSKFIILITSALLILSLFIGGFSLINTNKLLKEDSALMMNAVCTEQALRLDLQLQRIEQAVDTIYNYAQDELVSVEKIKESEFRQEYLKKIEAETVDGEFYLDSMAILPEYRGYSIGKMLLMYAVEKGKDLGCMYSTLLVDVHKPRLEAYYKSIGFEQYGEMEFFGHDYKRMRYVFA